MELPVVFGRMGKKPKGVAGFYQRGSRSLHVRKSYDLETTAHEIAHDMWATIPEIRLTLEKNAKLRGELQETGYLSEFG